MPFVAVLTLLASMNAPGFPAPLMAGTACASLAAPVAGPIVRGFAPVGSYGGHWGIDFGTPASTPVAAAAGGVVTFAGSVAGMLSVSLDHGGGLKTSYSYLSEIAVSEGVNPWSARDRDWCASRSSTGSHSGVSISVRLPDWAARRRRLKNSLHCPLRAAFCMRSDRS